MTVAQKLSKAMLDFRRISPYYSAIYQVIPKEADENVEILSITVDKILYHEEHLQELPYEELLFWILHGISHIALGHFLRRGARDLSLWNLACDFYVNRLLAEEFHFSGPGDQVKYKGVLLAMPENIAFSRELNLKTDFVEAIYQKLEKKGEESSDNTQESPIEPQDSPWKSQWEESERSTHPTCSHSHDFTDQDLDQDSTFLSEILADNLLDKVNAHDMLDSWDNILEKQRKIDEILGQAEVTSVFQQQERPSFGTEPLGNLSELSVPPIQWKTLLRRYLRSCNDPEPSFSHPDPRFFYQERILPGKNREDYDGLQGLKLCLDSSGSISSEQLEQFTAQVWEICKEFTLEGELIYWDKEIELIQPFHGKGDLSLFHPHNSKGTEPDCLFSYFESPKCKVKPLVNLIFTDGYFGGSYALPRRKRQFQNTLWIMSSQYANSFHPAFGKLVVS